VGEKFNLIILIRLSLIIKYFLSNFFKKIIKKGICKKILFSSVVPKTYEKIKRYLKKKNFICYEIKDFRITKIIKTRVKKISQVGSDRLSNAIGSYVFYKKNSLIIDFGTATTFDVVKHPGIYDGGVIAPGINLSIMNLNKSTALLPVFKLKKMIKTYGKNTKQALNAGFLWGYQGLINNIIKKISQKSKTNYKIILTGGYASHFKKYILKKSIIDQNITIKGVMEIYKKLIL
jgi:pantothenate kinase, type III